MAPLSVDHNQPYGISHPDSTQPLHALDRQSAPIGHPSLRAAASHVSALLIFTSISRTSMQFYSLLTGFISFPIFSVA